MHQIPGQTLRKAFLLPGSSPSSRFQTGICVFGLGMAVVGITVLERAQVLSQMELALRSGRSF